MPTIDTQGTVLQSSDAASPEVFLPIGQLVNIGEVGVERALIDVTNLASTLREYKGAIPDGSEIDLDFQYDSGSAKQTLMKTDIDANTVRNYKVLLSDSPPTDFSFPALVISWKIGSPIDEVVPLTVRIKITGSLSIT
jgi:hypothetical protein